MTALRTDLETVSVHVAAPVARVVLDRPADHNTVTARMVEELHEVLSRLAQRPELSTVVLTGAGSTFCPGADVRPGRSTREVPAPESYQSARLLHEMPQLTVAAINGGCAGAGFAWAAACDLRIASSRARFASAFLPVGVSGELGIGWTLPRLLGAARANELLFLADRFDAETAARIGFVARVVPDAEWAEGLDRIVAELAGRDTEAVRGLKRNLVDARTMTLGDYVELEGARHRERFTGAAAEQTYARLEAQAATLRRHGAPR
ncbi:Enoyl-CoA hydratase/carnithine racemase [Jatrophihabitans endophyticus]|uniref:Enoyl-CoA hydratase/carnithine racemase n=1 Tax=Jatrophihabitans endophyticus TaxID=1206085 RepID=A0A1M5PR63_9ACTN|nr:enoyl-CoA hydratase-related protein [Jatrophihabitans endophyticus]SHH04076.1 Enoyl-CoA hydratase/carnithine racemase [Jatrophihabitans endophyticus]